ncbi:MAG: RsmB/NOP family class I SAM-dependent RNA methyltransferase [Cyclobacteriaceae bacterium]
MKLYRNLALAVIQGLEEILAGNRYADKVVEKLLRQDPRWGSRDRRFVAETIYDIVRWKRLFAYTSGEEIWPLFAAWLTWKNIPFPAWSELTGLEEQKIRERLNAPGKPRAIAQSIPDWLDEIGEKALGDKWSHELNALNEEAPVTIRCNKLKIVPKELAKILQQEGIETKILEGHPDGLSLIKRSNIFRTAAFQEGLFEVQDAGSQEIAPFCKPEAGMRIIDACAGAGGKTLHLAALTKNKGRIIALDTEEWKLQELKKRARRAGISTIETRTITDKKVIKRLEDQADVLLLDVPCSGLGVLRRNPDAKWKLTPEVIEKTIHLQQQILMDYAGMTKSGGTMVYATCSILPQENEAQVQWFLNQNPEFKLMEEKHLLPSSGTDGFYMARLKRD